LFIKYQTDASRIANVLLIPPLMNTELYLEMRMMTVSCVFDAFRSIFHKYPLLVLYRFLLLLLDWAALICDPQAYASLWDDITKQLLSYSAKCVLTSAVACITHFLSCPSLSNTNSTKILELEDELAAQLATLSVGARRLNVQETFASEV